MWLSLQSSFGCTDLVRSRVLIASGRLVRSIMQSPSAKTTSVAWVRTADRHIQMEEIRAIAKRSSLTSRLSQVSQAVGDTPEPVACMERPKRKKFRWSEPSPQET
jgi:hypothetical protein